MRGREEDSERDCVCGEEREREREREGENGCGMRYIHVFVKKENDQHSAHTDSTNHGTLLSLPLPLSLSLSLCQGWDNVGVLIDALGEAKSSVIVITNDLTEEVLDEALAKVYRTLSPSHTLVLGLCPLGP
jgi:hypothetical protein